ncbi:50S ribosomal protein L19e [Saccharolobus islandicus]|jgi:large subunit ribosomal protein L19e|uniref:Large ribosomal subunit protein eL19 n=1 Tax=Saccharolobus islandicus (strain REY15A) TaxID=930945 RepID=F0NHK9_SACI5|nr:50S ribosomal protein L19e [Sulfolobus islandicus]ADX85373.1 Ribosomal protein L19e [Sulfolobus islandicus REY15A]
MTNLKAQKRLAASVARVGISRVKIVEDYIEDVQSALTREEIRNLIKDGKIIILKKVGISDGRLKERRKKKSLKSEGKKAGSRKGKKGARANSKRMWVKRIRKIRAYLKWLRDHKVIDSHTYRELYLKAKGGNYKGVSDVRNVLIQMGKLRGE